MPDSTSTPTASPGPPQDRRSLTLEWRLSTVCLATAVVALLLGMGVNWVTERHFTDRGDFISTALLLILFPSAALTGAASAFVFLLWKKRRQFAIELVIGLLLVFFFSTWESL